jgi:hypothetical protein
MKTSSKYKILSKFEEKNILKGQSTIIMSIFSVNDLDTILISELNYYDLSTLRAHLSLIKTNKYYQNFLKQNSIYFSRSEAIFLREWYLSKDWTVDYTIHQLLPILINPEISEEYLLMTLAIAEEKESLYMLTKALLIFGKEQGDHPAFVNRVLEKSGYQEKYWKKRLELLFGPQREIDPAQSEKEYLRMLGLQY